MVPAAGVTEQAYLRRGKPRQGHVVLAPLATRPANVHWLSQPQMFLLCFFKLCRPSLT